MQVIVPKFYKWFVVVFFIGSIISFIVFFYFMLGFAEIIIIPAYQDVHSQFIVDIKARSFEPPIEDKSITGEIFETLQEEIKTYQTSGKKNILSDVVGDVTLVNETIQKQILIATTRLQSPEGIIVRIKNRIELPPSGKIKVSVYPDNPSEFTSISPSRFIIPGLPLNLQAKIYGISDNSLSSGGYFVSSMSQEDMDFAERDLSEVLTKKSLDEFKKEVSQDESLYSKLVQKEIVEKIFSTQAGQEADQFQLTMKMRMVVIAFDEVRLLNSVKKDLFSNLPPGKTLKNFDPKDVTYMVERYDTENKVAYVKVNAVGKAVIRSENKILDRKSLIGLSKKDIINRFSDYPEIKEVRINFYPRWIQRAPQREDRIEIIIE